MRWSPVDDSVPAVWLRPFRQEGALYAVGAYASWGLVPIYWKSLKHVEPFQILVHRILWSLVFVGALLLLKSRGPEFAGALRNRRTVLAFLASAILIGGNWFLYIWAVNSGHVLESSLGYFVNPLVNVLLGFLFLGERLRTAQWCAVVLAAAGVLNQTINHGTFPWISLMLASSFGVYGLLRKTARVDSLVGLALETALLAPLALGFAVAWEIHGTGVLRHADAKTASLLILGGLVTAIPLLWFAHAARRLPLTTLGFFQYISPSGQFLLAVFLYDEAFTSTHVITFGCIWSALAVYTVEAVMHARHTASA
jgi:chloramphenicol-sensitive protein RarD